MLHLTLLALLEMLNNPFLSTIHISPVSTSTENVSGLSKNEHGGRIRLLTISKFLMFAFSNSTMCFGSHFTLETTIMQFYENGRQINKPHAKL